MTAITPFVVIQDHQLRYQYKARMRLSLCVNLTYLLSCTVFEIWRVYWSNFRPRQLWSLSLTHWLR